MCIYVPVSFCVRICASVFSCLYDCVFCVNVGIVLVWNLYACAFVVFYWRTDI